MTVGQQISRALTEQFYRWELRGRGWTTWSESVRLEPPFRPFEGHYLPSGSVADDGQFESFGSRFAKGMLDLLGMAASPSSEDESDEIEEPDAQPASESGEPVELQIALPPDYQPQANVFEQFLFSIGYASEPVVFEVVGSAGELVVQITTGESDAVLIRQQLKAFFPEAVVTQETGYLRGKFLPDIEHFRILDFGLEREFMVPLRLLKSLAADPLVAICGALDHLKAGEAGVFQVLVEPARQPWAPSILGSVSTSDGKSFFVNDPELLPHARVKTSRPLFAVGLRLAARASSEERVAEIIRSLAGAMRPLGTPEGNQLVPLATEKIEPEEHLIDLLLRSSHRSGMLLNSDEVVALVHLPTAAVRATYLRRAIHKTRLVPRSLTVEGVFVGENIHEGVVAQVRLPTEIRLNHCHILGGTGSGKSTLLALMAAQDMQLGHGVAVIDPHGDLIDALLPYVPESRLDDVILFDPSDEDYAIAFNPLAASSTREKELLAGDFIAVMRQHTSSWGDQMSSLLGNAVLAFLHNSRTGTLPELRRFLVNPEFRKVILQSVTNPEVAYYWEHEATLANKSAIGSILVRLDELLRSESLLHILGQRANKLDFGEIMDSGKIFLARLSKGLVGQANAYLLGGLLVSKFYQTTIARQSRGRENRRPYMLLMDEAGELLTSTISEILVGARKYGLSLTLAHQSLRQLTGDDEVYGAVTGSCGTKICFQVGGDDARKMADEFGGFQSQDLMNLPKLHAIARVGPRDMSFNLRTQFLPEPPRTPQESYADLRERTRKRYGTPTSEIRKDLQALREFLPKKPAPDPFKKLAGRQEEERKTRKTEAPAPTEDSSSSEKTRKDESTEEEVSETPALKLGKAEAIKNAIIQTAGNWGFDHQTEFSILNGKGRVDLFLKLGNRRLACEISATSTADQEVAHLVNCLTAGFTEIFCVCDATVRRGRIEALLRQRIAAGQEGCFHFLTVHQFQGRVSEIGEEARKSGAASIGGKAPAPSVDITREDQKAMAEQQLREIAERKAKAKAKRQPPSD